MGKNWFKKIFYTHPYVWIISIGFLIYYHTLFFGFTYLDDNALILNNYKFLNHLSNIFQAFKQGVFHSYSQAYYRPLLTTSLILDARIGGISPFIYHLTNIVLHLLASCLVFLFLIKLNYKKKIAFFFSLIFVAHPILTQAVAWIPGRNDSLLAIFILASFIFFLDFLKAEGIGKWGYYIWHIIFFGFALFTKETAIILPLITLLYIYIIKKEKPFSFKKKILILSWIGTIGIWFLCRKNALASPLKISISGLIKSFILNYQVIVQYIGKIIFPFNLSVLPIVQDTTFIYGFAAIIFLIVAIIFTKNKRWNFIIFGLSWFFLFLLPTLVHINPVDYFLEHRIYLPMIGILILLLETDLIKKINFREKKPIIFFLFIIITISIINFNHSNNFKNRLSFWKNAAKNSPHCPLAHRNLGAMYYLDNQTDKAKLEYEKALELNSNEPMAHNNLGLIYMNKKMFKKAEEEYKKELKINPFYDQANFNLGLLYYKEGKIKEAENMWKKTLKLNPTYEDARTGLLFLENQNQ